MARTDMKYIWGSKDFDDWVKREMKVAKSRGLRVSGPGVTKLLMDRVIIPNKVSVIPEPTPKKVRVRRSFP